MRRVCVSAFDGTRMIGHVWSIWKRRGQQADLTTMMMTRFISLDPRNCNSFDPVHGLSSAQCAAAECSM